MSTTTLVATAADTRDDGSTAQRSRARIALIVAGAVLTLLSAVVLLYPALAAPITADDRYWYLWSVAGSHGSYIDLLQDSWDRIEWRINYGRLNLLTEVERRFAGLFVMDVSVATATPIPVVQAGLKLLLLGGGVACVAACLRSLRWRGADGQLVRIPSSTLVLAMVAGTLALAVGAQVHGAQRNGWTAYPVSTYGVVITAFGSIALLLWLTRLVAERTRRMTLIVAVAVLVLLGFVTAIRYELQFPTVAIAAVALVVVPVTSLDRRAAGRRAKIITGSAYLGGFVPVLVASRILLSSVCAGQSCYEGVQMDLGTSVLRTWFFNVVSTIPGSGMDRMERELATFDWSDRVGFSPTWLSVLVALGLAGAMLAIWQAYRRVSGRPGPEEVSDRTAHTMLLVVGAGLALLVALGTAGVMALSKQSHQLITEPGLPYRNIVATWTGLAFCAVLVVLAIGKQWAGRPAVVSWTGFALVLAMVAAVTFPNNLLMAKANRVSSVVTDSINWEVVLGDPTAEGDRRRCALYQQIDSKVVPYARESLKTFTRGAYQVLHEQPFCSQTPEGR